MSVSAHTPAAPRSRTAASLAGALLLTAGTISLSASMVTTASATGTDDAPASVCAGLDSGKIDLVGEQDSVTVTAPDGHLIDGYCVKAGSADQGEGPVYVDVEPTETLTITYPSGKAISHYSLSYVATTGGTPSETGTPTPTDTAPETSTPTPTESESATPTVTVTVTETATATATETTTVTAEPTSTPTVTVTVTVTPTDTGTALPTDTSTPLPTDTGTALPTDTSTPLPTDTGGAVPTGTDGEEIPSTGGGLPATGASGPPPALGALLVLAGAGLMMAGRRPAPRRH